jgi:hypothetical protein
MEIILQPGCWTDINITHRQTIFFEKQAFGQQCFLLPADKEIHGHQLCVPGNVVRAFNASFEIMQLNLTTQTIL